MILTFLGFSQSSFEIKHLAADIAFYIYRVRKIKYILMFSSTNRRIKLDYPAAANKSDAK